MHYGNLTTLEPEHPLCIVGIRGLFEERSIGRDNEGIATDDAGTGMLCMYILRFPSREDARTLRGITFTAPSFVEHAGDDIERNSQSRKESFSLRAC